MFRPFCWFRSTIVRVKPLSVQQAFSELPNAFCSGANGSGATQSMTTVPIVALKFRRLKASAVRFRDAHAIRTLILDHIREHANIDISSVII
jgi:hypothetical protein